MTRDLPSPVHHLTRRQTLATGAGLAAVAVAVAGCTSRNGSETPDAVALSGQLQCDNCGMVIAEHPGPNGQIFFEKESPEGHENPARFDSLKACLFPYRMAQEKLDWNPIAVYVTDYSAVDYTVSEQEGQPFVSSHVEPESFALADELHFVVESDVRGAMGPDFVPFSVRADADAFVDEYGGRVVGYGDIGPALVGK